MANDLILSYERDLKAMTPAFQDVLTPVGIPPERMIRTVVISLERTPKLLECDRQTVFNAAMTFGVLGLEVDGATGQGFMIPFGRTAQPVIGYKGYNTMAGRSGYSIRGAVVREGDTFDIDYGRDQPIIHKPDWKTTAKDRRILGAWALAVANNRPPIPSFLTIDECLAIKAKSPGAKKSDSPWNDPSVGFPAMCEKSAKRRLARSMPLNVMVMAAAMEEAHEERGLHSWIDPHDGVTIEGSYKMGDVQPQPGDLGDRMTGRQVFPIQKANAVVECTTPDEWRGKMLQAIDALSPDKLTVFRQMNGSIMATLYGEGFTDIVDAAQAAFDRKLGGGA